MNYPFRTALLSYLAGTSGAEDFRDAMETIRENYPSPAFYGAMNFLSTHDTPRAINAILDPRDGDRTDLAQRHFTQEQLREGRQRLKLAAFLQFMLPGMPCIYYGDEAGVEGCADPFCRRTYPWGREDQDMLARYKAMAAMRKGHPVLKTGECAYIAPCSAVLGVIRKNENGKDAFGKKAENACAVTLINRSAREVVVYLTSADVSGAQTLVSDDGQIFTARSGAFSVKIKGLQGMTMFAM